MEGKYCKERKKSDKLVVNMEGVERSIKKGGNQDPEIQK